MKTTLYAIGAAIADWLGRIPFPEFLRHSLRHLTKRASQIHPLAPLAMALVLGYIVARITLWAARQPLFYLWPLFGWISGHDVSRLSVYNWLAHILALVLAAKVVFEIRPIRR